MTKILVDKAVIEQALEGICGAKLCEINSMSSRHEMLRLMEKSASALRAALDQPQVEQEPVAWAEEIIEYLRAYYDTEMIKEFDSGDALIRLENAIAVVEEVEQKYTHQQNLNCKSTQHRLATLWGYEKPQLRPPLTDEELYKVFPAIATYTEANKTLYRSIARAIEKAHGIGESNA